jgi:hypothetical protein
LKDNVLKPPVNSEGAITEPELGFLPATRTRLLIKRDGRSLLRSAGIPKPVVLVDTREQQPLPLFANHRNWIAGERRATLKTADYSIEGMENLLGLERKSLADLVDCVLVQPELENECAYRMHSGHREVRFGKAWGNAQKVREEQRQRNRSSAPVDPSSHTPPVIPGETDASRDRFCFTG